LEDVSRAYLRLADRIQRGELDVEEFSRRESITVKTHSSPGLRRLAAAAGSTPVGQKVSVYQRRDGSLALASEYRGDVDVDYLLRRLHDVARRFESLSTSPDEFRRLFPKVTRQIPSAEQPVQLNLF
jgi:hypothetical protein